MCDIATEMHTFNMYNVMSSDNSHILLSTQNEQFLMPLKLFKGVNFLAWLLFYSMDML